MIWIQSESNRLWNRPPAQDVCASARHVQVILCKLCPHLSKMVQTRYIILSTESLSLSLLAAAAATARARRRTNTSWRPSTASTSGSPRAASPSSAPRRPRGQRGLSGLGAATAPVLSWFGSPIHLPVELSPPPPLFVTRHVMCDVWYAMRARSVTSVIFISFISVLLHLHNH